MAVPRADKTALLREERADQPALLREVERGDKPPALLREVERAEEPALLKEDLFLGKSGAALAARRYARQYRRRRAAPSLDRKLKSPAAIWAKNLLRKSSTGKLGKLGEKAKI